MSSLQAAREHRAKVDKAFIEKRRSQQGDSCFWCGLPLVRTYQVDHVIPWVRGGPDSEENLVLSHKSCNSSKRAKLPWELQFIRPVWPQHKAKLDEWTNGGFSRELKKWTNLPHEVRRGQNAKRTRGRKDAPDSISAAALRQAVPSAAQPVRLPTNPGCRQHWPCPVCASIDTKVRERKFLPDANGEIVVRRHHRCALCSAKFETVEFYRIPPETG